MKKTKFSSVLFLSAACLLASCGNRAITPTSTSSPTEPASTSIVTPSTPATTSQDPIPSEQSQESEQSIPSEQSQESVEPTSSEQTPDVSSEQTPDISSGPAQDSSGVAPVSHVFAGTKNGVALDLVDLKEEGWTCWAYYKLDLAKDDKIVLTVDGTPVPFTYDDEEHGTEFVAPRDGTYEFYINSATDCWVGIPAAPAAKALKVEVNGAEVSLTPEENPGNDVAVYKVTLAIGDKLVVKGDGVALPLGGSESTEFTCKVAGEHTVYVNKEYKVYVTEPTAPVAKAEIEVSLEGWLDDPSQVVFAHSWKGEAPNQQKLTEKVANGKFNVIDGCDGFILICCKPGTTEIIWEGQDKNVVKQTSDLTVQQGKLAYSEESSSFVWVVPQA